MRSRRAVQRNSGSEDARDGRSRHPRRHHHRPLLGRSLRPADRLAAGGHRVLRQVGRRLPGQHRHRHRAARPEVGPGHRASATSRWAASSASSSRARASSTAGVKTDPERLTALVLLVGRERETFPADLLPRRTAPTWRSTRTTSTRPSSPRPSAVVVTGTHFSRPNTDAAQRKAMRIAKRRRPQGRLRHRLPPEPLGPRRPRRRRRALRQVRPRLASICRPCCPTATSIVGTEEEMHDRRRRATTRSPALRKRSAR